MTIEEILNADIGAEAMITALSDKTIDVPLWGGVKGLQQEYDPTRHPVMDKRKYPDIVTDNGIERVSRITLDFQRLAAKRMTELVTGIPVKRIYKPRNDRQSELARYIEAIYNRCRIDSVNVERCNMLFAGCEVMTLWYAVEQRNSAYGFESPLKMRCRNFSPTLGDSLYPLFDETGDMVAMSVAYTRKRGRRTIRFFDAYTAQRHVQFSDENGGGAKKMDEKQK